MGYNWGFDGSKFLIVASLHLTLKEFSFNHKEKLFLRNHFRSVEYFMLTGWRHRGRFLDLFYFCRTRESGLQ